MKIKETIQASPKWGKKGVGALIPLVLYYFFYQALEVGTPFVIEKVFNATWRKGMKKGERGMFFGA